MIYQIFLFIPFLSVLLLPFPSWSEEKSNWLIELLHDSIVNVTTDHYQSDWRSFKDTNVVEPQFSEKQWQEYKNERALTKKTDKEEMLFEDFEKKFDKVN